MSAVRPWAGFGGRAIPLDPEAPLIAAGIGLGDDAGTAHEGLWILDEASIARIAAHGGRRAVRRVVRSHRSRGGWIAAPPSTNPLVDEYQADAVLVELPSSPADAAHAVLRAGVCANGRPVIGLARRPETTADGLIAALDVGAAGIVVATADRERDVELAALARDLEAARLDDAPMFSIVICNHNGSKFVEQCLDALTDLRYPRYEVLFVDDGSTDDSVRLARDYPVTVLELPWAGLSTARNAGVAAANGELVLFLDNDTMAERLVLARLWRLMDRLAADGAGGPNLPFQGAGWEERAVSGAPGVPLPVVGLDGAALHLPGCSMAFRKTAIEAVGGFDPQFLAVLDDVEFGARMIEHGFRIYFHPAAVIWHRRRDSLKGFLRQQRSYGMGGQLYAANNGGSSVIPLPRRSLLQRLDPRRPRPVFVGPQAQQRYTIAGHNLHVDVPLKLLAAGAALGMVGAPAAWRAGILGRWVLLVASIEGATLAVTAARVPAFQAPHGWRGIGQRIVTAGLWLAQPIARELGHRAGRRQGRASGDEQEDEAR